MDRRSFLKRVSLAGVGGLVAARAGWAVDGMAGGLAGGVVGEGGAVVGAAAPAAPEDPAGPSGRAARLVAEATVIDMLNGFESSLEQRDGKSLLELWLARPESFGEADFAAYRDSGFDVLALGDLVQDHEAALVWIARWNGFLATNARFFARVDTAAALDAVRGSGRLGVMLTLQDSSHFRDADDVDLFHSLGQRVSQLTYNGANRLGAGAFEDADGGLTDFGHAIVERMNLRGMGVDLSHCGDRTTLDALAASTRPVLITHAACRALNPGYPRAKTDEMIREMAAKGGVIGIPVLRFMIRDREPVTVEHFLDHVDHVARLVGVEHVGIGSDQGLVTEDMMPLAYRKGRLEGAPPKYRVHTDADERICIAGIDGPRRSFDIAEGLVRRGYSDADVRLVLGGNFARALRQIWAA